MAAAQPRHPEAAELPAAELVVLHAAELATLAGATQKPKRGAALRDIGIIPDGAVASVGGRVAAVGPTEQVLRQVRVTSATTVIDASGKTVLPGFVDPHTHCVYAGSREDEWVLRLEGRSYTEILASGGGILSTVAATRQATEQELTASALRRLRILLAHGVTTAEVKSGYGLSTADELKMLRVVQTLAVLQPVRLVPTFLGAHAVPAEFRSDPDGYVERVVAEMLPAVAREGLARFCDVFCDAGAFSVAQARRVLEAGRAWGLRPKIHADEIAALGGAELAAELGAVSADHLVQVSEEGIRRLAERGVVAVLLPATTLFLMGARYAPARRLIEAGVPVALGTDANPGTSPTEAMGLVLSLACLQLRMSPAEAIAAATINAAHAIGVADAVGSLEPGKQADLVVFDAPNHRYIPYRFGVNLVETVVVGGRVVLQRPRG